MEKRNEFVSPMNSQQAEKVRMKIVCAWCKKGMGEKEAEIEGVSHGICKECSAGVLKDIASIESADN